MASGIIRVPATWMRGGTSKCWIFDADLVAGLPVAVDTLLLGAFGAADPRQIDGVGGATSTTSKAMLIRPSTRPDAAVEYTFAQVGIGARSVEWGSNCGNCATAAGLYAFQAGLAEVTGDRSTVRLYNTNSDTTVAITVDTPGGEVPETGIATVPGVEGTGVPVGLTFLDPAGGSTGTLSPTGHPVDDLAHEDRTVPATLVDAGAPAALISAPALGLTGTESIETFAERVPELALLRREAALAMGLATPADPISYAVPKVGVVGPPATYRTVTGETVPASDYDIACRMVSMHAPHPAIGLTSAVALAAAAAVKGSLVAELVGDGRELLRIGTPAGVIATTVTTDDTGVPNAVTLHRAARRLAVAELFVPVAS